jgi:hypothetical protein
VEKPSGTPDKEILAALDAAYESLRELELWKNQVSAQRGPPRFQVINRITCHSFKSERGSFLDSPSVVDYGPHSAHVRSSSKVDNIELFLERNKEVTFLVYRDFECCGRTAPAESLLYQEGSNEANFKALLVRETISIISPELESAMVDLGRNALKGIPYPDFESDEETTQHPYTWWFHRRQSISSAMTRMGTESQKHLGVFQRYLDECLSDEWSQVDRLLLDSTITTKYLHYLFVSASGHISCQID